jgi:RNA polymerase sigma-70 factor (ECF subfamily)
VQLLLESTLERGYAGQADRLRGRFPDILRTAVDHFAADMRDKGHAQKRGGGRVFSLDIEAAESFLSDQETPERQFDRQWARAILDDAMEALGREYALSRSALAGGACEDRVGLHRARKRFRELVRERVSGTVESAADVDEKMAALFESL